jgi:mannose-1-phosphate guanylyltransferase
MTEPNAIRLGIIMAGGSGERFWPLSRKLKPKQLLKLTSQTTTMLEQAIERLQPLVSPKNIYVVTSTALLDPIRSDQSLLDRENVIAEPAKRNTTGALCYAAAHVMATHAIDIDKITMAIVTADHQIGQPDLFRSTLHAAMSCAEQHDALVTIGIAPVRPDTGYGYIQAGESIDAPVEIDSTIHVYHASRFHEKPDVDRAKEYVAAGGFYWNSGMFFWKISTFLKELDEANPEAAAITRDMAAMLRNGDMASCASAFERLKDIAIDYVLLERAKRVIVVRGDFPWDDVGSWTSLGRSHDADAQGNVALGDPVLVDSRNCVVYNVPGPDKMALALVGCDDLVVVTTDDAVLVISKERVQDVRNVVSELKNRKANQL